MVTEGLPGASSAPPMPHALIDHAALRHNLGRVRRCAPESRVWAVVKADAYGHGGDRVVQSLDVDGFAVARIGEAVRLRAEGVKRPLLVMGGVSTEQELKQAIRIGCEIVLHDDLQGRLIAGYPAPRPMPVWLKVNTGMNRLGFPQEAIPKWLERLSASGGVRGTPGLMTHLANGDNPADPMTGEQCRRLRNIPGAAGVSLNIGNSAGILGERAARTDWVRPGIMLYGVSPFRNETGAERDLRPVMTLKARVIAVNRCCRGARIGYGGTYECEEDMPVGVLGIGYGDGYPRHAPGGTPVLIKGCRVPLVGRVSMDMITVDLRGLPNVQVGDEAVLWGRGLPAEEIAAAAGTIAYELLTSVTARVARVHVGEGLE